MPASQRLWDSRDLTIITSAPECHNLVVFQELARVLLDVNYGRVACQEL